MTAKRVIIYVEGPAPQGQDLADFDLDDEEDEDEEYEDDEEEQQREDEESDEPLAGCPTSRF
jgi:hypothetical protein